MPSAILDLTPFDHALGQLREALALWEAQPPQSVLKPHLRAAAIQAFGFTYELAVRMTRRVLVERAFASALVHELSFNDLLRAGADAGLVANPLRWREWRALRNITSHTYNETRAAEVAAALPAFVQDATALLLACRAAVGGNVGAGGGPG